jgi:hypothetical protein
MLHRKLREVHFLLLGEVGFVRLSIDELKALPL